MTWRSTKAVALLILSLGLAACGDDEAPSGGETTNNTTNNNTTNNSDACEPGCDPVANASSTCDAGACAYVCEAGFVDLDADLDAGADGTGCECEQSNGGVEICDGLDNDCDGDVDEEAEDRTTFYPDVDGDGFGDEASPTEACEAPTDPDFIEIGGDCDDDDRDINPDAAELCDDVDNDCDAETDEDFTDKGEACSAGDGVCQSSGTFVCTDDGTGTECDAVAGSPTTNDETTCDGLDNDCDAETDEGCDDDGDGYCDSDFTVEAGANCVADDCDDEEVTTYPGAPGLCDDVDNDCNGQVDEIRLVSTTPLSYAITGQAGAGTPPPKTMAAATDDGFCVVQGYGGLLNRGLRFTHVDAQGSSSSQSTTITGGGDFRVMDVVWTGTSCVALAREQITGGVNTATTYDLELFRWEPGSSTIVQLKVDAANLYPQHDAAVQDAAMIVVPPSPTCSIFCNDLIYVAHSQDMNDGNFRVVYRYAVAEFGAASAISGSQEVTSGLPGSVHIDLGPSPVSTDEWLITWRGYFGWNVSSKAYGDTSVTYRDELGISTFARSLDTPRLGSMDGQVYLAFRDLDADEVELRRITSSYTYDTTFSVPDTSGYHYAPAGLFADSIRQSTWRVTYTDGGIPITLTYSEVGWFLQPYSDELHRVTQALIPGATSFANANASAGDELLAVGTSGSYLQLLRMTSADPFEVELDEFTCY